MLLHIDGDVAALAFLFLLLLLAVIGGIVLHATFLSGKYEGRYQGFLGEFYDFMTFRKLVIEGVLKFLYVIGASVMSVYGIIQLFLADTFAKGILYCLGFLVIGNLVLRLLFELVLMLVLICKNLVEVNQKLRPRVRRGPDMMKGTPKFAVGIMPESLRNRMDSWLKAAVQKENALEEKSDQGNRCV